MKPDYHLTSDILEQQFGSLAVRIIKQTDLQRLICVSAVRDSRPLEYAFVKIYSKPAEQYGNIHLEIMNGALMGKAFRAAGVTFQRWEVASFQMSSPPSTQVLFPGSGSQAISVKVADILVGPDAQQYAQTIEYYAPEVRLPGQAFGADSHRDVAYNTLRAIYQAL